MKFTDSGVPTHQIPKSICYTVHTLSTCWWLFTEVHCFHLQWNSTESSNGKHAQQSYPHARETFTVLSKPVHILQATPCAELETHCLFCAAHNLRANILAVILRCLRWFQICGPCACSAILPQPAQKLPPYWEKTSAACSRSSVMQSDTWKTHLRIYADWYGNTNLVSNIQWYC